jgi:alkanesulfonate monooxygenase SsuD/methylene tetrahydromethanopterin reductase-like flavin-dependent oxidoreductase (luciferase family)
MRKYEWRSYPYLGTDEIADVLNLGEGVSPWTSQKVRRWVRGNNAAVRVGTTWFASPDRLREHLPEMWCAILPHLPDGDADTDEDAPKLFAPRSWPMIHTDEIAVALNHDFPHQPWTSQKVRRWLRRAKAGSMRGSQLVTTADQLREKLPDLWTAVLPRLLVSADERAAA